MPRNQSARVIATKAEPVIVDNSPGALIRAARAASAFAKASPIAQKGAAQTPLFRVIGTR